MRSVLFALGAVFLLLHPARSQEHTLRLKFTKGEVLYRVNKQKVGVRMEMAGTPVETNIDQEIRAVTTVLDVSPEGDYILTERITRAMAKMSVPGMAPIEIDTDKPEATDGNPMAGMISKPYYQMKNAKIKTTVTPAGQVKTVEGLEEMLKGVSQGQDLAKGLEQGIRSAYGVLPQKPVKLGESWRSTLVTPTQMGEISITMVNKLEKVEDGIATIKVNEGEAKVLPGQSKMPGVTFTIERFQPDLTTTFHIGKGRLVRSKGMMDMGFTVSMGAEGQSMTMAVKTEVDVAFLDKPPVDEKAAPPAAEPPSK